MLERNTLILIASVTLLIAPATLSAQTEIEDTAANLISAARDLDAGARMRFETRSSGVGSGSLVRVEPSGLLWADSTGQSARIDTEDLLRLEVRRPAWRKGALIGATVGVVMGALSGFAHGLGCEVEPGCTGSGPENVAVGAIKYGLGMGAAGFVVGSSLREWHTLYPSAPQGR